MHEGKPWKDFVTRSKELTEELDKYLLKPARPGTLDEYSTTHGYVWLYLRK
jgi:hypothetical protein